MFPDLTAQPEAAIPPGMLGFRIQLGVGCDAQADNIPINAQAEHNVLTLSFIYGSMMLCGGFATIALILDRPNQSASLITKAEYKYETRYDKKFIKH
jgi:hypothetical protein